MREKKRTWLATLLLPTIAGVAVGVVGYHFPLTYGDGSYQLSFVTKNLIEYDLKTINSVYTSR
jgi:hypothetical protein